ncbi:unnamed protein product [Phyllotreta striolata]|uniref:Uncharacterized protein n=1 Tax=Phyllotreta striolata TaxID=444603 RepID=A0A9N9TEQ4_PHYSR|nr:unnamed protein product [Phyllotreta striolata]
MDAAGGSIFQGANISISNSRNEEEEEDLEDQIRRKEELQNLLITKLDDFKFDESTVNSSLISAISDDAQDKFLKAENEHEQLKVLFEVRGRELAALREEHKKVTEKLQHQVDVVKKKLTLTEAEFEQLKLSYKNSEELLGEKIQKVNELTSLLENKEQQINDFKRERENLQIEISTYKSTIDGMHRELQGDKNPFSNINKHHNSEELKAAHKEQITKLETLLEEKIIQAKHIEKENINLKQELSKFIEVNEENSTIIKALTKNFEDAQNQCETLIEVVETLSNENKHLQDRVNNIYSNSPIKRSSTDFNTLVSSVEKLKKMLLDKSVQINTLNAKLNNYEENLKELMEYRKLKTDSYRKEFQQCDNADHSKNLILMQNDLRNYKQTIEDKNQQILQLNSTNKDLLTKLEETLSQTRNDIQTFSAKYSIPQLEKMTEELHRAGLRIQELEEQLQISEELKLQLIRQDEDNKHQLEALKTVSEKERNNFENEIKKLKNDLIVSSNEIEQLNRILQEKSQRNIKTEDESLKQEYLKCVQALRMSENKIKELEESMKQILELKNEAERDKCSIELKLKAANEEYDNSAKQFDQLTTELHRKDELIATLQNKISSLTDEIKLINKKIDESTQTDNIRAQMQQVENNNEANLMTIELNLREEIQQEYFSKLNEIEEKYQTASNSTKSQSKAHLEKLKNQEVKFRKHLALILSECQRKIEGFESERAELLRRLNGSQSLLAAAKAKEERFNKLVEELCVKNAREAEKWKLWSQKLVNNCLKIEAVNKKSRDNILFKMQVYDSKVKAVEKASGKSKEKCAMKRAQSRSE